jgi:hypothetical protein
MGLCSRICPTHKGKVYLFPHSHTHKIETKRTIKIKNPKNSIKKAKSKGKKPIGKNRNK